MSLMSMTGFGRGEIERPSGKLTVELKSVNHRFLDLNIKAPRQFAALEDTLRRRLQGALGRGHVDVFVRYREQATGVQAVRVDGALLSGYLHSLRALCKPHRLRDTLGLADVLRMDGVLALENAPENEEELRAMLFEALDTALAGLLQMRKAEGARLCEDILAKLEAMTPPMQTVRDRAGIVVEEYRDKLRQRVAQLTDGMPLDEQRLAQEVAFFADRASVDEEIVRFEGHCRHLRDTLGSADPIGRKLDFIVQEMNREANTICSKSADAQITAAGIALKGEVEKLREQVQNIE